MNFLFRILARFVLRRIDLRTFNENLPRVAVGMEGYTKADRHRDFRDVFFGNSTSEQGMRVYSQIVDLCYGRMMMDDEIDSHARLAARAGGVRIAQEIEMWAQMQTVVLEDRAE